MEKLALMMSDIDSVAIVLRAVKQRECVPLPDGRVITVLRYGEAIGYATKPITTGEWVHVHNLDAEKIM